MKNKVSILKKTLKLALFVLAAIAILQPVATKKTEAATTKWYAVNTTGYPGASYNRGVKPPTLKNNKLTLRGCIATGSSLKKATKTCNNLSKKPKKYSKVTLKMSSKVKIYTIGSESGAKHKYSLSAFKKNVTNGKNSYLRLYFKVVNGKITTIYMTV